MPPILAAVLVGAGLYAGVRIARELHSLLTPGQAGDAGEPEKSRESEFVFGQ